MFAMYCADPNVDTAPGSDGNGKKNVMGSMIKLGKTPLYAVGAFPATVTFTVAPTKNPCGAAVTTVTNPFAHDIEAIDVDGGEPMTGIDTTRAPVKVERFR